MSIPLMCGCGHHFEAPERDAGRFARCPGCGDNVIVPKSTATPEVLIIGEGWEPRRTSGKAIASLVLGLMPFLLCFGGIPAILLGMGALGDIRRSGGRLRGRRRASAGIVLGLIGCFAWVWSSHAAYQSAREAARRSWCGNNLKQIGLALHNYHEVYGCLPPAALTDTAGRPLLSWRVAILPFLECDPTYARFHLDEPWDSPHNLSLLDARPSAYACPSDKTLPPGMTGYQVVVGAETAFPPDFRPVRFADITDGTSDTLLVGESSRPVPWTKPEDLPFDMTVPLAGLGSHRGYPGAGFNALLGDGSVRSIPRSVDPAVVRSLLTRAGADPVAADAY